jgi:cell division protein FtsB
VILLKAAKINIKRLLMTAFVIYTAVTLINQQVTIGKLTTIQKEKTQKVESIKLENQKLEEMIKNASTDESIEKMAREQLGLVKPGEKVYINQSQPEQDLQGGDN